MENNQQHDEKEVEGMIKDYQSVQNQLRATSMQVEQLQMQKADMEMARKEIESSSGKVFISVGGVLVETTKESALKDITEKQEVSEVRLSSATKMQSELKTKEKQLRETLTKMSGQR